MATWLPIWKRLNYDIKQEMSLAGDSVRYRIRVADTEGDATDPYEGRVIHEGIASAAPNDTTSIWISPNEVAAAYLSAPFQDTTGGAWHSQLMGRYFAIDYWNNGDWLVADYWGIYANWSYDHAFDIEAMGLSHPIRAIAAPNQWLVASVLDWHDAQQADWRLTYADGTTQIVQQDLFRAADFNSDFNNDFAITPGDYNVAGYAAIYLGLYNNLVRVELLYAADSTIVIADYAVVQECKRYALYYRNAYGGMDSLLLDGVQRKETYARSTITRNVDNSVQGARAIQNYRNGVVEGWELRLNSLTDEAASRMHHLVGSAEVYLCDLIADTLTPLVLTDSECVARTFANGHKRLDWKLAATTAQVMRRE